MSRLNFKLGQKALVLVLIPLFLDVVFLSTLLYMLDQSRIASQEEEHARLIVIKAGTLTQHLAEAAGALAGYQHSRSLTFLERYQQRCKDSEADLGSLRKAVRQDNFREHEILTRIEQSTANLFSCLKEGYKIVEDGFSESSNPLTLSRRTNQAILNLKDACDQMVGFQMLGRTDILSSTQQAHSAVLMNAIIFGIIGNVAVAISLTLYFNSGITSRLKQLMGNTERLSRHEELMPCLTGSDEIALLDKSFHTMADKLAEAEKLKKDLMAMVSHDLRTPITSGLIFLEMLDEGLYGVQTPECKNATSRIQSALKRLVMLVNELLDFEKIQASGFRLSCHDSSTTRIIERSLESVSETARLVGVTFDTAGVVELPVRCDEDRLVQVIVNLTANAIKFSPANGEIFLSTQVNDGKVVLKVRDQGPGVPEEMRDRIFEEFQQVKGQSRGGFGLGLAIARRIVDAHNGRIYVIPYEKEGSVFVVEIPGG